MAGMGSSIGSLAGGAIGTALLPGIGTALGSFLGGKAGGAIEQKATSNGGTSGGGTSSAGGGNASKLSLATGLLQNIQANKLDQRAQAAMPSLIDPNQSSYLAELNQKRKSLETGAAFASANQEADTAQAQASNAIVNASGGDVGSTVQSLLQSQRAANDSKNNAIGQGQAQQLAVNNAYQDMLNQISGRKLQLQMYNTDRLRALEAQKRTFANQNTNAGLGRLLSGQSQGQGQTQGLGGGISQLSQLAAPEGVTPSLSNDVPETAKPNVVPESNLATQSLGTAMAI